MLIAWLELFQLVIFQLLNLVSLILIDYHHSSQRTMRFFHLSTVLHLTSSKISSVLRLSTILSLSLFHLAICILFPYGYCLSLELPWVMCLHNLHKTIALISTINLHPFHNNSYFFLQKAIMFLMTNSLIASSHIKEIPYPIIRLTKNNLK